MESGSSDDSDYEPAPVGKPHTSPDPPPVPPPRARTLPRNLALSHPKSPARQSLFHTMRKSLSADLKVIVPEGSVHLSQFITHHSTLLPCQVRLAADCSVVPSPFPSERRLNLHFIKHSKVVVLTSPSSGAHVASVPLNSAAKFSVLYDPHSDIAQAQTGYNFDTVRDVMAKKPMPSLMKATRSYLASSPLSSVYEGEILSVKGTKTFLRSKQLRVQNSKGENKSLSEKCTGLFTTAPDQISLPITSLMDLGIQLPTTVVCSEDIADFSQGAALVMERISGETYLIASDPSWTDGHLQYFEISSDLKAEVELEHLDYQSQQGLLSSTHDLFHSFSSATPVVSGAVAGAGVLPGREQEGVQLVCPITIDTVDVQNPYQRDDIIAQLGPELLVPNHREGEGVSDDGSDDIYAMPKSQVKDQSVLEFSQAVDHEAAGLWMDTGDSRFSGSSLAGTASILSSVEAQLQRLNSISTQQLSSIEHELQELKSLVRDIHKDLHLLQQTTPTTNEDEECKENKRAIANMDCEQVCI